MIYIQVKVHYVVLFNRSKNQIGYSVLILYVDVNSHIKDLGCILQLV